MNTVVEFFTGKHIRSIVALIALTSVVRLGAYILLSPSHPPEPWEYEKIALSLASGNGFNIPYLGTAYHSRTTPMYPFICAAIYSVFGVNHELVILTNVLIACLAVIVIFDLARRIFGPEVGQISGILYALHPGMILYTVQKLHPLILDSFFLAMTLWSFVYLNERLSLRRGLIAGLITGLCVLTRSTIIAFLPAGLLWLVWRNRIRIRKAGATVLVFLASAMAVSGIWAVRNYRVQGEFVLTTSGDAEVFWRGNNINASGTSYSVDGMPILALDREMGQRIGVMSEMEQRRQFRDEASRFIWDHPGRFIKLFLGKLYYFWWFSPTTGILYPKTYLTAYKSLYVVFILMFIAGLYGIARREVSHAGNINILLLFMAAISVAQSLFYVDGRHRWGIEPVFLIISSAGLLFILRKLSGKIC